MRIITIYIERHNNGDSYYTDYIPCKYKTAYDNEEVEAILGRTKPKYIENTSCDSSNTYDIDLEDLDNQLMEYGIFPIQSEKCFYIDLEDEYK